MKLAAKYDVEAPVDFVFAQLIDFEGWERRRCGAAPMSAAPTS